MDEPSSDPGPSLPAVTLPKGGGAIRGLDEKFATNAQTGTGSFSVPIAIPSSRGFAPALALTYDSGAGNGPFGLGWTLGLPAITRKTSKGVPRYQDDDESDVFILSGAEDLVPGLDAVRSVDGATYQVRRYRPRVEGLFARIERWTDVASGDAHWRSISRDNVTMLYGRTAESRLADPTDPRRVFSWLACETHDDKGNAALFEYKPEDSTGLDDAGVHERNRTALGRSSNRYLKRVFFGNRTSRLAEPISDWMFEVVLDYGEHDVDAPTPASASAWACRADPFSTYRSGFEIRTYRLCRRILVFHHFPAEDADALVRATELAYDQNGVAAKLVSVRQSGFRQLVKRSMPALTLGYSPATIHEEVMNADAASLEGLPPGPHHWVDLDGDGVAGVLAEQGGGWFYKRNSSPGHGGLRLGPVQRVAAKPAASLSSGAQLADLAGDGHLDVVLLGGAGRGFYERDGETWASFHAFVSVPNVDPADPNLRLVDLDGDGLADLLISRDEAFTIYPSLGERGFGPPATVRKPIDEEEGPRLVFADATESIYLADMSGDGLTDLVRVRSGAVCYWPNLGQGRFGAKVTMDAAPRFEERDQFEHRRLIIADIDGSGPSDLIYLGRDEVRIYLNQAGNSWSEHRRLTAVPPIDNVASVSALDLLGTGTACLVWSSPFDGGLRYIDLMGGEKPHILTSVDNGLGAETRVSYAPSAKFSVVDREAGRPWRTQLPFPVQVVERIETFDRVAGNRFVTRYAYHDGYYDGIERELGGFGVVEQWDTEDLTDAAAVPPALTRTWFHTGAVDFGGAILQPGLTADEEREACRALRGNVLRQEVYGLDGSAVNGQPYTTSERTYAVRRLQPRGARRHGVFLVHGRETIDTQLERDPDEPRVHQTLALAVDDFGNVLRGAAIGYGRRGVDPELSPADQATQARTLVVYTESTFTNAVAGDEVNRVPALTETGTHEVTGLVSAGDRFTFDEVDQGTLTAAKRLVERLRTTYRRDDLSAPLPPGRLESLALPFESYRLVLPAALVTTVYEGRVTGAALSAAGYQQIDGDWWAPSGRIFYAPDGVDELAHARAHFFLPYRLTDPFGNASRVAYDRYDLLVAERRDALDNRTAAENDYRVLQPRLVTDANGNRRAVAFDALCRVAGHAVMGKAGELAGDSLDGFDPDPSEAAVRAYLADPRANPQALLQRATARLVYDVHAAPAVVCTITRVTHDANLPSGEVTDVLVALGYSDGFGRTVQQKVQAEPGPDGSRWAGTGWTIFNNKGKPVRQYEPFLSATPAFEQARVVGRSAIRFYDPLSRVLGVLHPHHAYEKITFTPWKQLSWDASDTVLVADPRLDSDLGDFFRRLPEADYLPTWYGARVTGALGVEEQDAASKTAAHAETPLAAHFDALGRPFLTISHNRFDRAGVTVEERLTTRFELDLQGRKRAVTDALDRVVERADLDLAGNRIRLASMEAGERWVLYDVTKVAAASWDSRGHAFRFVHDELRRPRDIYLGDRLVQQTLYGEAEPDAEAHNLRTRVARVHDGAGVAASEAYDFEGNLLSSRRQLASAYRVAPDWSGPVALEAESHTTQTTYDALARPLTLTMPDGSVVRPSYSEANLLARIDVAMSGVTRPFVTGIEHDAQGRRTLIRYGNGARTQYEYDPDSFRLMRLSTARGADERLQDIRYTYDPVGSITRIRDFAQQTVYFRNQVVEPTAAYTYDAIHRLIEASGREHLGQVGGAPVPGSPSDAPRVEVPHPSDGAAMAPYRQRYGYDAVGNILELVHRGTAGAGWTRTHGFEEASLLEPGKHSNRLTRTVVGGGPVERYAYDAHGNTTSMPHLPVMTWDHRDRLATTSRQVVTGGTPETTYYVDDGAGVRARKVTERQAAPGQVPTRKSERLYLGGFEIYREYAGDGETVTLERKTLHVVDGQERVALVETRTLGDDSSPGQLTKYQIADHLGSASLELDDAAQVVSYEEYYPYGGTSYQAVRSATETPKRYRHSGQERDEESGFYAKGVRYYAPWLGRWMSADPSGLSGGENLYRYAESSPIVFFDRDGRDPQTCVVLSGNTKTCEPVEQRWKRYNDYRDQAWDRGDRGREYLGDLRSWTSYLTSDEFEKYYADSGNGFAANWDRFNKFYSEANEPPPLHIETGAIGEVDGQAVSARTQEEYTQKANGIELGNLYDQLFLAPIQAAVVGTGAFGAGAAKAYFWFQWYANAKSVKQGCLDSTATPDSCSTTMFPIAIGMVIPGGEEEGVQPRGAAPKEPLPAPNESPTVMKPTVLKPTQPREQMTGSRIKKMAKDMKANGTGAYPPIEVVEGEEGPLIKDGHHRAVAAAAAGKDIQVKIVAMPPGGLTSESWSIAGFASKVRGWLGW